MTYEPGQRLGGDEYQRPFIDWVVYGEHVDPADPVSPLKQFSACYFGGALLHRAEGWWRFDWARFAFRGLPPRLRVNQASVARAWECRPRGWAPLPSQWDLF